MTVLSRLARSRSGEERAAHPRHHGQRAWCSACRRCDGSGRESFSAAPGNIGRHDGSGRLAGDQRLPAHLDGARDRRIRGARRHRRPLSRRACRAPVRLDFFGDTLESDPRLRSRRRSAPPASCAALDLVPVSEVPLDDGDDQRASARAICELFGAATRDDPLYEAVSEGRRHRRHGALAAAVPRAAGDAVRLSARTRPSLLDHLARRRARRAAGADRRTTTTRAKPRWTSRAADGAALPAAAAGRALSDRRRMGGRARRARAVPRFTPVRRSPRRARPCSMSAGGRAATSRPSAQSEQRVNVFDAAVAPCPRRCSRPASGWSSPPGSDGSRERLAHVLARPRPEARRSRAGAGATPMALTPSDVAPGGAGAGAGFETDDLAVVAEQDILGDRLVAPPQRRKRAAGLPRRGVEPRRRATSSCTSTTASAASTGWRRSTAAGAPHDCLRDPLRRRRQALPAGREHRAAVALRLGGHRASRSTSSAASAWQARKARLKQRIRDMAGELIRIAAAARRCARRRRWSPPEGALRRVRRPLPL